jgi:hypothetical protein
LLRRLLENLVVPERPPDDVAVTRVEELPNACRVSVLVHFARMLYGVLKQGRPRGGLLSHKRISDMGCAR